MEEEGSSVALRRGLSGWDSSAMAAAAAAEAKGRTEGADCPSPPAPHLLK